jgi:hypothetical protein
MHFWQNNTNLHESQPARSFAASNDHDAPQLIDQPVLVRAVKVDDEMPSPSRTPARGTSERLSSVQRGCSR